MTRNNRLLNLVWPVQAIYYLVTGIWPFLSIRTFLMITGPKTDIWLVKTVGALVGVIGAVLAFAWRRRDPPPEIPLLAVGSALSLTAIDVVYVLRGRIWPVYLLDALAELVLVAGWVVAWLQPQLNQKEEISLRSLDYEESDDPSWWRRVRRQPHLSA